MNFPYYCDTIYLMCSDASSICAGFNPNDITSFCDSLSKTLPYRLAWSINWCLTVSSLDELCGNAFMKYERKGTSLWIDVTAYRTQKITTYQPGNIKTYLSYGIMAYQPGNMKTYLSHGIMVYQPGNIKTYLSHRIMTCQPRLY